jgi:pimeloyl-ACP methyl ester carboxylesterase
VLYPADAGADKKYPAVVIIPGGLGFGSGAARTQEPFTIARAGFMVGYFDPDGRGRSEGREDWNGKVHQDGLHAVLKHVAGLTFVDKSNIGVVSSSLGLAMAAGALGRYPDDPPVKYFIDIEGPSDRFYITKNDSRRFLDIFAGHTTKEEHWWAEREAVRSIKEVRCAYPLSLGVEKVFWAFGLIEGFKHDDRYFDHTGLIYSGRESGDKGRGVRKLAYHTYKLLTENLEGKQFAGEITGLPDHVNAYHFRSAASNSSLVTVVWWDWWNEASASIKSVALPAEAKVTITSAITDARGERTITAADAKDGRVALSLGRPPLFVESLANR